VVGRNVFLQTVGEIFHKISGSQFVYEYTGLLSLMSCINLVSSLFSFD